MFAFLFTSVVFSRNTLLLAEEVLMKQLSFQEVYVNLAPAFYTESCKWKREAIENMLDFTGKGDVKILLDNFCEFLYVFPLGSV